MSDNSPAWQLRTAHSEPLLQVQRQWFILEWCVGKVTFIWLYNTHSLWVRVCSQVCVYGGGCMKFSYIHFYKNIIFSKHRQLILILCLPLQFLGSSDNMKSIHWMCYNITFELYYQTASSILSVNMREDVKNTYKK